jgi:lipopolysaccharide/colanic/teichoic acid biosynthesis glycosyltransferase
MIKDPYPDTVKRVPKWVRFEKTSSIESQIPAGKITVLYIGEVSEFSLHFKSIFHAGIMVQSFSDCYKLLDELPSKQYPDVICIDLPLDKKALKRLYNFLSQKKILSGIVIVYNERHLSDSNIPFLKETEFVDDVINLETSAVNLSRKIRFLKKVKSTSVESSNIKASEKATSVLIRQKKPLHLKRAIDIIFALFFLILLSPLFILIALAIKLDSRGPVVYSSLRAGRGFKIFKFYKFRTMVINADQKIEEYTHLNQYNVSDQGSAKFIKIANDPRITRLGRILRNCSLDELPQLINVLKGDMSLVGNRPLPLYEASTLTTNNHVERFMAPAGITGLWQIKKRGKAEMSTEERINLDISYARHYNIVYDLWIVAKTPAALFQKSSA